MSQIPTHGVDIAGPGGEGYDPATHAPPAGDWRDDDGIALDQYFEAMNLLPQLYGLVQAVKDEIKPSLASRMLVYDFFVNDCSVIGFPYPAVMALPADPNRQALIIQGSHNAGLAGLYYASESFQAQATIDNYPRTPAAFVPPTTAIQLVIPNYTGPLWLAPAANTAIKCSYKITALTS